MSRSGPRVVYVVGAGLSAGLGFPVIGNMLPLIWSRLRSAGLADELAEVIRFHHPGFNPTVPGSYIDVEQLLSEMRANEQLFNSSRPATGTFTSQELGRRRQGFLLEMAAWFHEKQKTALATPPDWLTRFSDRIKAERAQVISFNWDLVLDELLFGKDLCRESYGLDGGRSRVRLLKPHGSLNWFKRARGRHLAPRKRFHLAGTRASRVYAFKAYRAPHSRRRSYMPLIVPPVLNKEFQGPLFRKLWQEVVSTLSTASEVNFIGYSLPPADFHARFILRCAFHNQEHGEIDTGGVRRPPTGRAAVTIVDPNPLVAPRIEDAVGWRCDYVKGTVEDWVATWK